MPCGVLTSYGEALRRAEGNVYFAGTETATTWAGMKLYAISKKASHFSKRAIYILQTEDIN
jgi:hypothetical protein